MAKRTDARMGSAGACWNPDCEASATAREEVVELYALEAADIARAIAASVRGKD